MNKNNDDSWLNSSEVSLDVEFIKNRMSALGLSRGGVGDKLLVGRRRYGDYLLDGKMPRAHLEDLARALGVEPSFLLPKTKSQLAKLTVPTIPTPHSWEFVEMVAAPTKAANGLIYEIVKLKSTFGSNILSRGKYYRLDGTRPSLRAELKHRLERHVDVCEMVESPYIANHRAAIPFDGDMAWWVLDRWVDGKLLAHLIDEEILFSESEIQTIGTQILLGLQSLHEKNIIMRELSPERIIYADREPHITLTDFEMAKLMDKGVPSVSDRWKTLSPYRALEVVEDIDSPCAHSLSFRSDIFSWGIIMMELLTGKTNLPVAGLRTQIKNDKIADLLIRCTEPAATKRPRDVSEVLALWTIASKKQ